MAHIPVIIVSATLEGIETQAMSDVKAVRPSWTGTDAEDVEIVDDHRGMMR